MPHRFYRSSATAAPVITGTTCFVVSHSSQCSATSASEHPQHHPMRAVHLMQPFLTHALPYPRLFMSLADRSLIITHACRTPVAPAP